MPIDPAKFNAMLDETDAQQARLSTVVAPSIAPAEMARAQSIASKRGLPPLVVADSLADWDERERLDATEEAAKQSPAFARWFQAPEHAALAKGEEGKVGLFARALEQFNKPLFGAYEPLSRAVQRGLQRSRMGEAFVQGDVAMFATAKQSASDLLDMTQGAPRLLSTLAGLGARTDEERRVAAALTDPLGFRAASEEAAGVAAEVRKDQQATFSAVGARPAGADFLRDPVAALEQATAYYGVRGAASAPAMSFALAARNPRLAAGLMGAPTGAQTYSDLRAEGLPKWQAAAAGVATGGAEILGERVGLDSLLAVPLRNAFTRGVATEAGQEAVTQLLQDNVEGYATGQAPNVYEQLSNAFDAAVLGGGFGATVAGVRGAATRDRINAAASVSGSVEGSRRVADIVQTVGELGLGKHSPDALRRLAEEASPEAKVYLSAEQARTLFQSERLSADAFVADLVGDDSALREAEATGGDVVIPMAAFVSKVATLPNAADIAQHVRLQADHLSRAELESDALDERLAEWFGDTGEAADRADPETGKADSGEQVTQDVLGMLLASGRYRPADAELQAQVVGRVFGRMAARSGQDAFDLYSRYKLRINDQGGRQGKPNTLDPRTDALLTDIRRGTIPDGREVFGDSLLSFLVKRGGVRDSGGELVGRDALRQRPGLVSGNGVELDMAREAAVEAGYLPEDADINALLDAMDQELRGTPVYSEQFADQHQLARRNQALDLQRAMDENEAIGAMTDAEFQALSNQELHDLLFPPERSLLQRVGDRVRSLFQAKPVAPGPEAGVEFARAEEDLKSRLEQWGIAESGYDPLRGFGFDQRESASGRPDGHEEVGRGAGGRALTSRERKTAAGHRLIEAAKSGGFFLDDALTAAIAASAWGRAEGAEHDVHFVGAEGAELAIRATANGNFGPLADITPAEYLQRLRDFNQVFPETQIRVIGVSEDADGNAVIWSAQPFVKGKEFATEEDLAAAMAAHGWKRDGQFPRYIHEATGAIIEDAHTGNILHIGDELFPIDVVVEKLPSSVRQIGPPGGRTLYQDKTPPTGGVSAFGVDEATGLPLNADGTVTVFHHTSAEAADAIRRTGRLKSAGEPDVYVTTQATPDTGYGATVVAIAVDPSLLQLDDEFPDGRRDYRIDTGKPGGSIPIKAPPQGGVSLFQPPQASAEAFAQQVRAALEGKMPSGHHLKMGRTPAVLQALGLKVRELVVKPSEIRERKHGLPEETIAQMPALIADPVAVFRSTQMADRLVVLTSATHNGAPVVAVVQPDANTGLGLAHLVTSFHPKDNPAAALTAWAPNLLYVSQEKGPALWTAAGVQFPDVSTARGRTRRVLTEADVVKSSELAQPADGGTAPRGRLRIGVDRTMAIDLFKGADLSTFLHESAHFFLEVMQDVAETSPEVRADLDAIRAWVGNEGGAFTEDQHEQFARGWEAYLREGKAPAPELVSMFARFRAWLLDVYRDLRQLNVTLTDEVRGVFDRMLATDEEIEAAQVRQGMQPLTLADEARALLSPGQWEAYVAATAAATEEARNEVLGKLLRAHQREAEAWWKEQLAAVRAEVEAEFEAAPVVRAWRVLAGRGEQPEHLRGLRLDRQALVNAYGEQWVKEKLLRLGVYRKQGGVHPDTAAAALGFSSGDALVKALAEVRDLQARIDEHALARMRERHPEPMTDGSLPELAMDAVHSDRRVAALEAEQAILAKLANQPAPPARLVREYARRKIAALTVRGIRPNDYLVAERKAARATAKAAAAGDYAEALRHKRAQALNAAFYSEARQGQERAERQIRALRKLAGDKARERIGKAGKSYLDALDALLEGHELRPVSAKEVRRREALRAWIKAQQDADNNTAIAEDLLARVEAQRVTNVLDLTMQQLADLHEAAGNIAHLARLKNELTTKRGRIEWQEAKAEVVARLEQIEASGRTGISDGDRTLLERAADANAAAWNWVLQPETIIEWADGGESGPLHDLLWQPSEEAEAKRNALQRKVGAALKSAFDSISKEGRADLNRKRAIRSLETSLSGHTILSALLNMGNAGNRDKLLRGGRVAGDETVPFTPEQLAEMFSTLSAEQARLVQDVWDAVDLLWPDIVALEESLSGFAPPKVEAEPFTVITRDGPVALSGGYYPAVYDPRGSKAGEQSSDEQAKRVLSGQTPIKASTSKGHLEKRTEYVAPLLLDYHAVLSRHLAGVIGDIAYRQFLKQMYRVLGDADIRRMLDNRVGPNATKALRAGFERGAVGSYSLAGPLFGPFQGVADAGLTNIAAMSLGFRVPLALANIVTAPILATARVKKRYLVQGFSAYYRDMRGSIEMIHRLSPMMAKRAEARTVELQSILDSLAGKNGLRKQMIELAMSVHQWIVPVAENAIWLSRYLQAQAAGASVEESIALADKAIRQTQTKHQAKDLSQAEGNPYLRALMMFAGPMVIINNRLQESGLRGLRGPVESPVQALGVWIAMAAGGSWVFELMMGRGPDDDDDDGLDAGDWAAWCAKKLALMPFGAYPILRDVASKIDQGYSRPHPLVDAGNSIYEFGRSVFRRGDELFGDADNPVDDGKLSRDAVRATGVVTGLPTNQMMKTGTYLMEVLSGEHVPTNPAKEAVYILQGPPKDE